jgi:hypothetical protein
MVVVVVGAAVTVVEASEWLRVPVGRLAGKELERRVGRDELHAPAAPARTNNAAMTQVILLAPHRLVGLSLPVRAISMLANVIGRRQMTRDRDVA